MNAVVCAGFGDRAECFLKKVPSPRSASTATPPFVHCVKPNNKSAHVNTSSNWSHWVFEGLFAARKLRPSSVPEHPKMLEQEATLGKMCHALFIASNKLSAFTLGLDQV